MKKRAFKKAVESFRKEQEERQVEEIKEAFRKVVNAFNEIKEQEEEIKEVFKELGFKITPEFRKFLKGVEKYEDLIIAGGGGGQGLYSIGTTDSSSVFLANTSTGEITPGNENTWTS